jgi:Periplasmic sensor domain
MSQNPLPSDILARSSVRAKLMRDVLLTTALALAVSGIAMLLHELYVYRTVWTADITSEAAIVALSAVPALTFGDHGAAERNLNTLETRRRVMVAALYLPNGAIFASFVRQGEKPPPLQSPRDGVWAHGEAAFRCR